MPTRERSFRYADKLTSYNGQSCVYDAIGNPTTYRGKTATWTRGRKLTAYDGNTFSYDATGRRLSKNSIKFYYDSEGTLLKQSNGLEFFYGADGLVAIKYGGLPYLCRKDMLGNILALLDSSGNVVVQYKYDAWGNHTVTDANGNAITDANHIGNLNPFRYRGYYFDCETGFYFLQSRYYDPEVGRFLNMDSIEYANPESVNGINLYSYCINDPVNYIDPWGTFLVSGSLMFLGGLALLVLGVAGLTAVSQPSTANPDFSLDIGIDSLPGSVIGDVPAVDSNTDLALDLNENYNEYSSIISTVPMPLLRAKGRRSGRTGNRGKETALIGVPDSELEELLEEAKRNHDTALAQKIRKELKHRARRNQRKQRGGPHMRGIIFFYLFRIFEDIYDEN